MYTIFYFLLICSAFFAICSASKASDEEIMQLTEQMLDVTDLSILPNIKINTKSKPLFIVSEDVLKKFPTITKMRKLFDNYEMNTLIGEKESDIKRKEQDEFIGAVLNTDVMKMLMQFFVQKGAVGSKHKDHVHLLRTLWFRLFCRGGGIMNSCGFKHIFLQEISQGSLSGMHNWVFVYDEQKKQNLFALKEVKKIVYIGNQIKIMKYSYSYDKFLKPANTMFIGTPPELDMALYTLCIVMEREHTCPVSLGQRQFNIRAYSFGRANFKLISSAFPDI